MVSFIDISLDLENLVKLFSERFVFTWTDVKCKNLRFFETRIFGPYADSPRTSALVPAAASDLPRKA